MDELERHELRDGSIMYRVRVNRGGKSVVLYVGVHENRALAALEQHRKREALIDQVLGQSHQN